MSTTTLKIVFVSCLASFFLGVSLGEKCDGYYNGAWWVDSFDCPTWLNNVYEWHCCGDCNFKYCCDSYQNFDQDECDSNHHDDDSGLTVGAIAGIVIVVVGVVVGIFIAIGVGVYFCTHPRAVAPRTTVFPSLGEYCGAYTSGGVFWNGFSCPGWWDRFTEQFCCGNCYYKYCCDDPFDHDEDDCHEDDESSEVDLNSSVFEGTAADSLSEGLLLLIYIVCGVVGFIVIACTIGCVCCYAMTHSNGRSSTPRVIQSRPIAPQQPVATPRTEFVNQPRYPEPYYQDPRDLPMLPPRGRVPPRFVPPPPMYSPPENDDGAGPSTKAPLPP